MQEIAAWFNSFKGLLNLWQAAILFHDKPNMNSRFFKFKITSSAFLFQKRGRLHLQGRVLCSLWP